MTKQRWWFLGGAAGVAALAVAIAQPGSSVKVETGIVSRGAIAVTVNEEGRTRLKDLYVLAAPVAGRVARISVLEGHRVRKGDLLARIYPSPEDPRAAGISRGQLDAAEARQMDASAQVQKAQLVSEQSERELTRALHLLSAGALSEAAVDGWD